MKSVIAQGATISKAIDEALKKAGMPKEFFVKLLEEGQVGFLGFGSTKAKVALFYKETKVEQPVNTVLSQSSYKNLFDNKNLQIQIDQQEKVEKGETKPVIQHPAQQEGQLRKGNQRMHHRRPRRQQQRLVDQKQAFQPQEQKQKKEIKVRELEPKKQQDIKQEAGQKKQFQRRPKKKSSWGNDRRRSKNVNNGNDSKE